MQKGTGILAADQLDSLGPCFASNIPDNDLSLLSSDDIISKITFFVGDTFQPNQATADIFTSKIDAAVKSLNSTAYVEDLVFNTLQDAAIFATNISKIVSAVRDFNYI